MSPFNPLRSLLLSPEQVEAEKKLDAKFNEDQRRLAAKQWSQLVAWSWLTPDDYTEELPSPESETLRLAFIDVVKALAQSDIENFYSAENNFDKAVKASSQALSNMLSGETCQDSLTLPKLYQNLTNEDNYIFSKMLTDKDGKERRFADFFWWGIMVDRFTGSCISYDESTDRYVLLLAYPPRPSLNSSVLTAHELFEWSSGKGTGNYLPDNPYIPTCNC